MAANVYITPENAINGLGDQLYRLLKVAVGTDVSANAVLLQKIDEANSTIDSHLRGRYNLPLPFVPSDLISQGVGILRWLLALSRQDVAREDDRIIYEDSLKYLTNISKGVIVLDVGAPEGTSEAAHASVVSLGENDPSLPRNQSWMEAF